MPDQDPPNPPTPPTTPAPPSTPPGGGDQTPGAVVTIEDVRVGSGGDKQDAPPSAPSDPNSPPAANRGTEGGSRTIKVTVQLPPTKL